MAHGVFCQNVYTSVCALSKDIFDDKVERRRTAEESPFE